MATNEEMLQKVVETSVIGDGNGGILNAGQANRFLDYVFDQAVLMKTARVIRMSRPTIDIDKMDLGRRIMKKATEGVDDGNNTDPTFTKISLTTVKLRLDWELTTEGLEDNIEGTSLEDHVASLMARQTSNDLEDLYIHGDTSSSDDLLKSLDGWRTRARADAHVVDAAGDNLTRAVFDKALRNMPNKYLQRRSELRWSTSSSLLQDYLWSLTITGTNGELDGTGASAPGSVYGDAIVNGLVGGASGGGEPTTGLKPFGIPLWEIPLYEETEVGDYSGATGNHGVLELTFPNNRIVGIQRDITMYRKFEPKKDTMEYTQYIRVANQIENADSYVAVKNVKVRSF